MIPQKLHHTALRGFPPTPNLKFLNLPCVQHLRHVILSNLSNSEDFLALLYFSFDAYQSRSMLRFLLLNALSFLLSCSAKLSWGLAFHPSLFFQKPKPRYLSLLGGVTLVLVAFTFTVAFTLKIYGQNAYFELLALPKNTKGRFHDQNDHRIAPGD